MVNLLISLAFVVIAVVLLQKKFPNTLVFLVLGLILAVICEINAGGTIVETSSGSLALDVFETFKEQLITSFRVVGLAMLPVFGYSVYMDKIHASSVLGEVVAKPVARAKNPYFVGVFVAVIVCAVMRIAITSAFAIMAILFTTLYPAMLRAGLSKKTALSAIFLGTCFDWGPADFVVAIVLGGAGPVDVPGYFIDASLKVIPIAVILCALVSGFIMQAIDKREGYVLGTDAPVDDLGEDSKIPRFYAILPLLPMILIIIFSKIFFESVSISVVAACLISVIAVWLIELIRKKDIKERCADAMSWATGMGTAFGKLFLMIAAVQLFAGMLSKLGGFAWLVEIIVNTGMSGWVLILLVALLTVVMAILIGEPSAVTAILAGPIKLAADAMGIPFYAAIMPIQAANGFRCLSIGTGPHMQFACGETGLQPMDVVKRCAVPCAVIFISVFVSSYFILG